MTPTGLERLLKKLVAGKCSVASAVQRLRQLPFEDLGFAHLDHHRELRCGFPEVIYCPGKTPLQLVRIAGRLLRGGGTVLATRAEAAQIRALVRRFRRAEVERAARAVVLGPRPKPTGVRVAIVTAGTSDIPVAEEARV